MPYNKRITPEPPRLVGKPLHSEEGIPAKGHSERVKWELQEYLRSLALSANQANVGLAKLDAQINGTNTTGSSPSSVIHPFLVCGS